MKSKYISICDYCPKVECTGSCDKRKQTSRDHTAPCRIKPTGRPKKAS